MNVWHRRTRGFAAGRDAGGSGRPAPVQCPHCLRMLRVCPSCRGSYDNGRLCQACMFGAICPACQRYWTWT